MDTNTPEVLLTVKLVGPAGPLTAEQALAVVDHLKWCPEGFDLKAVQGQWHFTWRGHTYLFNGTLDLAEGVLALGAVRNGM